ncbi:hypothetical protein KR51_00019570 [Rubidibacter lacunae KORDI 51-2]|uniref:Low-complexity tail membrane protein n=1 Tax=Rubidibacter lacunae KORDI 51-2 TaxID=582515 RepID=U5DLD4_9CHRO|nr:low-complexity tail membrane protein [Rubidibacter lacunae]ERN41389.1 hypothetical protein KR51_00019570 [Rubidibacter lacunae KORDI 51-2]
MRARASDSFRLDPYLWIHFAGLGALPACLLAVWLGLAAEGAVWPVALDVLLVGVFGCVPIAWMQWQQPFDIFSLLLFSIQPQRLTEQQRRILRAFGLPKQRIWCAIAAVVMPVVLWQIARYAPAAAVTTPIHSHWLGVVAAAVAFFAANLFLQVPLSVAGVLLTGESTVAGLEPYPVAAIRKDFFVPGIRVASIVPSVAPAPRVEDIASLTADEPGDDDVSDRVQTDVGDASNEPVAEPATEERFDDADRADGVESTDEPPAAKSITDETIFEATKELFDYSDRGDGGEPTVEAGEVAVVASTEPGNPSFDAEGTDTQESSSAESVEQTNDSQADAGTAASDSDESTESETESESKTESEISIDTAGEPEGREIDAVEPQIDDRNSQA